MSDATAVPKPPSRTVVDPRIGSQSDCGGFPAPPKRNDIKNAETTPKVDIVDKLTVEASIQEAGEDEETLYEGSETILENATDKYIEISPTESVDTQPSFLTEIGPNRNPNYDDPTNLPNEPGFSRTTRKHLEVPREALDRVLLKDETVLGYFDYYYPQSRMIKSYKAHFVLTLCTAGMYLLYLLACEGIHAFQKFFKLEPIGTYRGKMVATSRGRLIFWKLVATQWHLCGLDGRAHFKTEQNTRIFNIADIKETTVTYHRMPAFLCFFSDSKTSLEVVFNSFPVNRDSCSQYFRTSPAPKFMEEVNTYSNAFASFFDGVFSLKKTALSVFSAPQPIIIRLVSKEGDKVHHGQEHGLSSLQAILDLNLEFTNFLNQNNSFSFDTFTSIDSTDELYGFKVVEDDFNVVLPKQYIPLTKDEKIISKIGQKYISSREDLFFSILTFGLYYFCYLKGKLKQSTALILTNKRLIEFYTQCPDDGRIPINLAKPMSLRVRSVYPGTVYSGYINTGAHNKQKPVIQSSLLCSAGAINVFLRQNTLTQSQLFAKAMQSVACRDTVLDIDVTLAGIKDEKPEIPPEVVQSTPLMKDEKILYYTSNEVGYGKLLVTNRTILRLSCAPDGSQMSLWLPASDINGQTLDIKRKGAHAVNFFPR